MTLPVEPPPTRWSFPDRFPAGNSDHAVEGRDESEKPEPGEGDLIGVGADLEPGTILAAYRRGLFPMNCAPGVLGWWSPDPRGILPLDGLHVSRSLRRSMRKFEFRVNTAFGDVIRHCADPSRPHGWITPEIIQAYTDLHEMGWAHSVETWTRDGELAGGLYGIAIGGFFAAESKFHRATDASKAAVAHLIALLRRHGGILLDVQWKTDHLAGLGVVEISRTEYVCRLRQALERPLPGIFTGARSGIRTIDFPLPGK